MCPSLPLLLFFLLLFLLTDVFPSPEGPWVQFWTLNVLTLCWPVALPTAKGAGSGGGGCGCQFMPQLDQKLLLYHVTPTHWLPWSWMPISPTCTAYLCGPSRVTHNIPNCPLQTKSPPELGPSPQVSSLALSVESSHMPCSLLPSQEQPEHCMRLSCSASCWACRVLAWLSRLPPSFLTTCWNLRLNKDDLPAESGLQYSRNMTSPHSYTVQCVVLLGLCVSVHVYVCVYVCISVGRRAVYIYLSVHT